MATDTYTFSVFSSKCIVCSREGGINVLGALSPSLSICKANFWKNLKCCLLTVALFALFGAAAPLVRLLQM